MKTILTIVVAGVLLAGHAHAQSQLLELSPVEQHKHNLARQIDGTAYQFTQLVLQMNRMHASAWALPTADVEALLNDIGAAKVQELVAKNAAAATAVNAILDGAGNTGPRALVAPGRHYTINEETGYITVTPLPEQVTEEEPSGE
jgi:hypothetical protein